MLIPTILTGTTIAKITIISNFTNFGLSVIMNLIIA
jgi:hypothetical protein